MPIVPHYPSDEPDPERVPDIDDIVGRILDGDDDPVPASSAA